MTQLWIDKQMSVDPKSIEQSKFCHSIHMPLYGMVWLLMGLRILKNGYSIGVVENNRIRKLLSTL